jgi:hypothetical protein
MMPGHRIVLLPLVMLGLAASAPAPRSDPGKSRAIAAIVADIRPDDRRATPARVGKGIRIVDANADGIADYLFSLEAISSPGWCGTGGCRTQLWLGRRGGAPRKIFDAQVREAGFRIFHRRPVFDVDLHGSACHSFGATACPASFAWNKAEGRMVEQRTADGGGTIRLLRPLETLDRAPPLSVQARLSAMIADCRSAGGTAEAQDAAMTVPDVDGDGLRDWMIAYVFCSMQSDAPAPEAPMGLFASSTGWSEALSTGEIEIRLGDPVADVFAIEGESCRRDEVGEMPCLRVQMRWDPGSRRFVKR